jgi:hypothetical protein
LDAKIVIFILALRRKIRALGQLSLDGIFYS